MRTYTNIIREIGRGRDGSRDLDDEQAYELMSAMLDGGVPDLELGGVLIAMRMKSESDSELRGQKSDDEDHATQDPIAFHGNTHNFICAIVAPLPPWLSGAKANRSTSSWFFRK